VCFKVLTAVIVQNMVWVVTQCGIADGHQHFRENYAASIFRVKAYEVIYILGFCILLHVLYQGYWKNRPLQQLF
jgi:hypothetical protein